jgi:hypothetical protein
MLRPAPAELASALDGIAGVQRMQAARCDALVRQTAEVVSSLAALEVRTATALATGLAALDAQIGQGLEACHVAIAASQARAAEEREALQQRCLMLERLLANTAAARPPGAAVAVARLPKPAVAVILPSHNRAAFVGEAIASVQAQGFRDWEMAVVDNGSTDGTEAAVAPFLADPRIRLHRLDHVNMSAARNHGIAATTAPLIAYIDSDNLWYPDFLACAVDCMATAPHIDLLYGALVSDLHDLDQGFILWRDFSREALLRANYIDTSVIMHRRHLVAKYGGWDPQLGRLVDWDLVLRYTAEKCAHPLPVLAARYRRCDDRRITDTISAAAAVDAIRGKLAGVPTP